MKHRLRASLVVVAVISALLGEASVAGASANGFVPNINTNDRAQVARTYLDAIEQNVDDRWTGSIDDCDAGNVSDAHRAATIESINWFRRMAGLQPVVEDPTASRAAQTAALMMDAQNTLSHYPTNGWRCFAAAGSAAAGLSNLTLGVIGSAGVVGQMEDLGAANRGLGHRRWLLYPQLETVGIGSTDRASAIQVIGDFGTRQSESPWITWPPAGFVPDETVFARWSISHRNGADFRHARVTVTENGSAVPVEQFGVQNGFGDPTLAFEVSGIRPAQPRDVVYQVTVENVIVDGKRTSHSYQFRSFDPHRAAAPADWPTCRGVPATIVGTAGADVITGTSGPDVIVALGGDDQIRALGGDDLVCGGGGNDWINGGWGADVLDGGQGRDHLLGNNGHDRLLGANGRDTLNGGKGNDSLIGGRHGDTLVGNAGRDQCWGQRPGQAKSSADSLTCERTN